VTNWSGTHSVEVDRVEEPESQADVEAAVRRAHAAGTSLRPAGSCLSPNGLSFQSKGMITMGLMDKVIKIDAERRQVTVQAGATVQAVADALRPHGLTLQNFASIREQQIGGFIQVSAHGTGAGIPPVDATVVALKLVTPGEGTLTLTPRDGDRFELSRVGLGALGVVTEVTLQCVPAHRLLERTFVATRSEVTSHHARWLREHRHLRYMWIPYTDDVVVVTCDPTDLPVGDGAEAAPSSGWWGGGGTGGWGVVGRAGRRRWTNGERLAPLRELLARTGGATDVDMAGLTATQLRDALLALSPLTKSHVARVNQAEAEYWRRSQGQRVGWSDEILGFDCGGQQWVLETAFPVGTRARPSGADLAYMEQLLTLIERHQLPAPAPIEQRWSGPSSSLLSPAYSADPEAVFSWVGVIMYLPTDDPLERSRITAKFREYVHLCEDELLPKFGALWHWAKLEPPAADDAEGRGRLRRYLRQHYPVDRFNSLRRRWDPKGILASDFIEACFGSA